MKNEEQGVRSGCGVVNAKSAFQRANMIWSCVVGAESGALAHGAVKRHRMSILA